MQAQSSSPYIPFVLEDYTEEEVTYVSKDNTAYSLSENIKSQLQLLIPHLETDITTLVQDAGAIRSIYSLINDELTPQLKEILQPIAYIECHEPKFSKALSRLAAHEAQKDLPT
jgi:hypothetical protein